MAQQVAEGLLQQSGESGVVGGCIAADPTLDPGHGLLLMSEDQQQRKPISGRTRVKLATGQLAGGQAGGGLKRQDQPIGGIAGLGCLESET